MDEKRGLPQLDGAELGSEIRELFPAPGAAERVWVVEALLRIRSDVPWLEGHFGGPPDLLALQDLLELWRQQVPPEQRRLQCQPLKGDFDAAGIMVGDHGAKQAAGMQVLRGLVWLVLRRKRKSKQSSSSAIRDLAAALRAARTPTTIAAEAIGSVVPALGRAGSIAEAIEGLSPLASTTHQSLSKFWTAWLRPALQLLASEEPSPVASPTPPPPPPPKGPSGTRHVKKRLPRDEEDELDEITDGPRVERLVRSAPFEGQEHHEPSEEFGDAAFLVSVPGKGSGLPERLARFYAQRAIWTGNGHLLTNHVDVLLPDVFGLVMRNTVARLEASHDQAAALGGIGCLLKALSGRTTAGIKALRIGESGPEGPIGGGVLDLSAGLMWIPVFWKEDAEADPDCPSETRKLSLFGHFRPSPEQRALLCPATDRLALPLPATVRTALRSHRASLERLSETESEQLDHAMTDHIADLRQALHLPMTIGGVRRSLAPLVMEQCGDPAMAQLICGESLGLTMAPLSYYAPKMKTVAEVYAATLAEHFGPSPLPRIPASATRIGSELLVTHGTAEQLATSSRARPKSTISASELTRVVQAHRTIADHLARMTLATTGHRPSEALFEITLADIDLESGAALFRDKRHDAAHDPRLACVPRVVAKQIRAYQDHIQHLQQQLPSLSSELVEVIAGRRPLLFDLDNAGKMVRPTLAALAARGPDAWRQLPGNWSRTWLRTRALEAGAPAFLMGAQLGHFDSIGYPYSNQSPTEPLDVLSRTQPWLDKLAQRSGWSVVESDLAAHSSPPAIRPPPPLRDWRPAIEQAEKSAKKAHREWEQRLTSDRRQLLTSALEAVLCHPLLVDSGLAAAHQAPEQPVERALIEGLDVERVRDDLVVACGDDAIAASWRIRALNKVSRQLAKQAGVTLAPLPLPIPVRRPLDNPFFQGACLALTQITALRHHVQARSAQRAPQRDFDLQVGRTVEALLLFAGIDDVPTIHMLLDARKTAVRSAKIADLVLVPIADGRCVALRGVAALAFAAFSSEFPDAPLPENATIEAALQMLLPEWVADNAKPGSDLLACLCSTVAVANRFEYSPAARFASDPDYGSTQATIEEQIAFIDGDPVGPTRATTAENAHRSNRSDYGHQASREARRSSARAQYTRLTGLLPKRGKALNLPLTGVTIPATLIQTEKTRDQVIAELQAWLALPADQEPFWPVVRMLAEWTLAEAQRMNSQGRRLADRSVATYLSRIGSALVRVLGHLELWQWDEKLLEDAYAYALDASEDSKHKVAAALLSFHQFCEAHFYVPDADLGAVYAALGKGKRRVDAAMILPVERDLALARLGEKAWEIPSDPSSVRRARLAEFVGVFLARTGARFSEPLGVTGADLGRRDSGDIVVTLRPNRMRKLKTEAGRRASTFKAASPEERTRIWTWREDVRRQAPPGRAGSAFLTAEIENARAFGEHGAIGVMIRSELAQATGRPLERLHRLRHLTAQERLMETALSADDAADLKLEPFANDRPLSPRDFAAISIPLGHSHWMTTIQWYLHMPWILQSRAAARISQAYFGRKAVAGALGYTPAFLDNLLRERRDIGSRAAWFNRFRRARTPPQPPVPMPRQEQTSWAWSAKGVAQVINQATRCKDLDSAIRLCGVPLESVSDLARITGRWERKLGRRLLPEYSRGKQRSAPGVTLRRLEGDSALESLWDGFDQQGTAEHEALRIVAKAFFSELIPDTGESVILPDHEAHALRERLIGAGIPAENIELEEAPHDMVQLSAYRTVGAAPDERSVPYGLRRVLAIIGIAVQLQDADGSSGRSNSR